MNVHTKHFPKPFRYHTVFPDANNPPPRPPRTPSTDFGSGPGSSVDEFGWTFDAHLPAVIVTPCTPTEPVVQVKTGGGAPRDGSPFEERSSGSLDSATTCPTSNPNSNPLLNRSTSTQNIIRSFSREQNHCRTRSLTGTGYGWKREQLHQRLSQCGYVVRSHRVFLSSLAREVSNIVLPNPVHDFPCPSPPSNRRPSDIHPGPSTIWNSGPAVPGQRVRLVATSTPVGQPTGSSDQMCAPDRSSDMSMSKVNDSRAADERKTVSLKENPIPGEVVAHSTQDTAAEELGLVPYPDVFDLDAYYRPRSLSDESLTSGSSLYASCSTPGTSESSDSLLASSQAPTSSPMFSQAEVLSLRLLNDASSSSEENDSTSCSKSRRFGLITDGRTKSKMDYEVKRYRDHYRPPAYSRPPAFTVEYPATMKKPKESRNTLELSSSESLTSNMSHSGIPAPTIPKVPPLPVVVSTTNASTTLAKTKAKEGGPFPSQIPRAMSSSALRSKRPIKPSTKGALLVRSSTATHLLNASVPAPLFRPRVAQQGPGADSDKCLSGPPTASMDAIKAPWKEVSIH